MLQVLCKTSNRLSVIQISRSVFYSIKRSIATPAKYGSWTSPLSSKDMTISSKTISRIKVKEGILHWLETRSDGRVVITQRDPKTGENIDITPPNMSAYSYLNDYGPSASYILMNYHDYLMTNKEDNKLYLIGRPKPDGQFVKVVTDEYPTGMWRFGDMEQHPISENLIISVREQHAAKDRANDKAKDVVNCIITLDMNTKKQTITTCGNAFYSAPCYSPNGKYLAYISWNHPNMPWNETKLYISTLTSDYKEIYSSDVIEDHSSILEPRWSPNGEYIYYLSDKNGFWNIYKYDIAKKESINIINEQFTQNEFGEPLWFFGQSHYDFIDDDTIIAAAIDKKTGVSKLLLIQQNKIKKISSNEEDLSYVSEVIVDRINHVAYTLQAGTTRPPAIVRYNYFDAINLEYNLNEIVETSSSPIDSKYISIPQTKEYKTSNGDTAFAFVYCPKNDDFKPLTEYEKPPLLVISHGGPTSSAKPQYNELILFFTTRGWTVADVNYRGSTGFGTIYRNLLYKNWGIYDRDDCINIAKELAKPNDIIQIDDNATAIRGSSAGGYTTLCCLTFDESKTPTFKVGCSQAGISDIQMLVAETEKFEAEQAKHLLDENDYSNRSPIDHVDKLRSPVIFLHGEKDKNVPVDQAKKMHKALMDKGIKTSLCLFDEEHHFVNKQSQIDAYDFEYTFYSKILGFPLSVDDQQKMNQCKID
eukprot:66898_1